jgi:teichoic acid transport system ATP-binding protein
MAVTDKKKPMTGRNTPSTRVDEDIDFDAELDDSASRTDASTADRRLGAPSLIVDNVHVKYRIFGGKRTAAATDTNSSRMRRILRQSASHMGPAKEIHALRGVTFLARHGESIGVVGRNGSGKSTLLRAIAGLLPLADGSVYVSGQASLLGVNAALMKGLTGERNIMIGGLALGLTKREVRERMDEIVDFAGIGDFVYQPMQGYSSGMSARLRFAISSAARPDILMIDEALATGDAEFRAKGQARIEEIREHAGTVFLVSHSLKAIRQMCTRALWIDEGRLRMDGPTDDVADAYQEFVRKIRSAQPARSKT